ncbi:hypothetical protein ATERTT37_001600 [Aspergillus terreus]
MSYRYDPDLEGLYSALRGMKAARPLTVAHDIASVRQRSSGIVDIYNAIPLAPGVERKSFTTKTFDGHDLELVWYAPERATTTPGPALLQIHGGGFIAFSVHDFHPALNNLVAASGVPMLCVDYRLAPENPYPVPLEDCYTALTWLRDHATELQVDPARIGVIGDSAGGGLAAGLALLARDRKFRPPLAKQVLMAPMLDDRIAEYDERMLPLLTFTYADKTSSWTAYIGRDAAGSELSIAKHPYCWRESQRLNTFVVTATNRMVVNPNGVTTPSGVRIPKGTMVYAPSYPVMHDPDIYPDPESFKPFRLADKRTALGEEGQSYVQRARQAWTTTSPKYPAFGHGCHACLGRFFASTLLKLMLAYILMNYDFQFLERRPENMWIGSNRTPPMKATIMIKRRVESEK